MEDWESERERRRIQKRAADDSLSAARSARLATLVAAFPEKKDCLASKIENFVMRRNEKSNGEARRKITLLRLGDDLIRLSAIKMGVRPDLGGILAPVHLDLDVCFDADNFTVVSTLRPSMKTVTLSLEAHQIGSTTFYFEGRPVSLNNSVGKILGNFLDELESCLTEVAQ